MSTAKSKAPTKSELRAKITALRPDTKIPSKATVAQLSELLVSFEQKIVDKPKAKKARKSSKNLLRALFAKNGYVTREDIKAIARECGVKEGSVETGLTDLRNPKYAAGEVVNSVKDGDRWIVA